MEFRKLMRKYRLKNNLTQKELASLLGKHLTTVNKYEIGKLTICKKVAQQLIEVLEIPKEEFETKRVAEEPVEVIKVPTVPTSYIDYLEQDYTVLFDKHDGIFLLKDGQIVFSARKNLVESLYKTNLLTKEFFEGGLVELAFLHSLQKQGYSFTIENKNEWKVSKDLIIRKVKREKILQIFTNVLLELDEIMS